MVNLVVTVAFLFLMRFASSQMRRATINGVYYGNPCDDYQKLNGELRAVGSKELATLSDNNNNWKLAWYRFIGPAGDKMVNMDATEECPVSPSCGAKYPGFLEGSHPEDLKPGEEVERTVCFAKSGNCCFRTETTAIRKCQGFWIYKLPRPSLKGARYCGNNGNNLRNAWYPCKELKKCIRE